MILTYGMLSVSFFGLRMYLFGVPLASCVLARPHRRPLPINNGSVGCPIMPGAALALGDVSLFTQGRARTAGTEYGWATSPIEGSLSR